MTRQAQVGAFALLAVLLLFGVFYVVTDFGTRHTGYRIGVHFRSAAGLTPGGIVYFSGVSVGSVDSISLLPDNTVDVILAVNRDVGIPRTSKFLIQAPLTGSPNLIIVPPAPSATNALPAMLERRVLPVAEQPDGTNSATIADLLQEGQGQIKRFDTVLADLERREPKLLNALQQTLANTTALTASGNQMVQVLSTQVRTIADTLQSSLGASSRNIEELTGTLNDSATIDSAHLTAILTQFQGASVAMDHSMDALQSLATDPRLKSNVLATTKNIAETTNAIAGITSDLHSITGDPQTKAQVRNTIANLNATMQRADSLLGALGGTSSVYGVDAHATPYPIPSGSPISPSNPNDSSSPTGPTAEQLHLPQRMGKIASDLIAIQLRISALDAQRVCCPSPQFSHDRGPQTDFNAIVLPHASTSLMVGANDIGYNTTANVDLITSLGENFRVGGGVLYSQFGVLAQYQKRAFGLETRAYNLRRPSVDLYGSIRVLPNGRLFFGERDLNHAERRTVYGLQLQF